MIIINNATVSDKLYFYEKNVNNFSALKNKFLYHNKEEAFSSLKLEDKDTLLWSLPSNCMEQLKIDRIKDERIWERLNYSFKLTTTLRKDQKEVVNKFFINNDPISGILQAACGYGKTFAMCNFIAHSNRRTIILVHTKLLFNQWIDELEKQIPNVKIGKIGDGLFEIGDITVAIYKSASNKIEKINKFFSIAIIDEVHNSPAKIFSETLNNFHAKIKIGISATPERRDGKHLMLPDYFTNYLVKGKEKEEKLPIYYTTVPTDIYFHIIQPKRDWTKQLTALCNNNSYIDLIASTAITYSNRYILILAQRLNILAALEKKIPNSIRIIGATTEEKRKEILSKVGTKYKVVLSNNIFDEGVSCNILDTFFFINPSSNYIKLTQRIGRIIRKYPNKEYSLIVDFLLKGNIVQGQQRHRELWYESQGYKKYATK